MDNKLLLIKSITLLYRENQLNPDDDNSADLILNIVDKIKTQELSLSINTEREVIAALKETVLDMCKNEKGSKYDKFTLLQTVKHDTGTDITTYKLIEDSLNQELSDGSLKRAVVNLRKSLNNYFREEEISNILGKASYIFRNDRNKIKDINQFVMELTAQLEALQINNNSKDPAIVGELDIGDEKSTSDVFREVKETNNGSGVMRTGWQALNRMLQGGFRRGETVLTSALQHKYKTGFTLSIFKQIALYNTPYMIDPTKKPLLLRISFEDDLTLNLQFLYQALQDTEKDTESLGDLSIEEMSKFIKDKLQVNGYHVKMMRVDPTQWTYKHICNKVIELEAQGYEIHLLMVDYLQMLPTTGCAIGGPMGADKREMLRRMRNFCAPKKILFITPHQLSTEAKQLLRDGRQDLVKEIVGLGYYDGCRTLDNEADLELHHHIEKYQKKSYFTVQRGKHRLPTVIPEDDKYFVLEFPKKGPIPDDLLGEDSSTRKVGSAARAGTHDDSLDFSF
jgi:hypothetical protein